MVFPKWTNSIGPALVVSVITTICVATFVIWYWFSPKHTFVGYEPEQPVHYSHRLHAGELGIDCRYCHFGVEEGKHAGVPPVDVCMNCHTQIKTDSPEIQKVREAFATGNPIEWVRIHKLADFAYFDHSAHVNKGVSCVECHGRVDQMEVVRAEQPLSMSWCIECHDNPAPHLRDKAHITQLGWKPTGDPLEYGKKFVEKYHVQTRTDCSTCHR